MKATKITRTSDGKRSAEARAEAIRRRQVRSLKYGAQR